MRAWVRGRPIAAFAVLAWVLTWSWCLPFVLRGDVVRPGVGWPTHLPALLGPAVAATVVTAVVDGPQGLRALRGRVLRWRVPARVWVLVLATTVGVGMAAAATTGGVDGDGLSRFSGFPAGSAVLTLVVLVGVNGFGEETGWRGFAQDRLLARHSGVVASLIVAVPWMIWHLPYFWLLQSFRDLGAVGLPGFLLGMVAGAVVLGWLYEWSGRSVAVVAVWHGLYNLMVATDVGGGVVAAVVTTEVMVWAVATVWWQWRRDRRRPPASATAPAGKGVASRVG